jgi:hypothetical protein
MILDPMSIITGGKEILDAGETVVALLKEIKGQLFGQPEPAAKALATVLEEIEKTYRVVDDALSRYLGVLFNPDQQLYEEGNVEAWKELLQMDGKQLSVRLAEARTHSQKVERIYQAYLKGWFQRVFGPLGKEFEIQNTFHNLWGTDSQIVLYMNEIADWLGKEVQGTLDLVAKPDSDLKAANIRIQETREKVKPYRDRLGELMTELRTLEGDFADEAGILGL